MLFGELPGNCQPFGFASGPVAIAATSCQTAADDHKEQQVQRIDPVTGKVQWTYKVKKGWEVAQFYSVSPLVVSLKQEDKWAIIVLNENGTYRSQLVGGTDDYGTKCGGDLLTEGKNLDNCLGVAADDRMVYLATKPAEDDLTPTNKVVAFDLNTGQAKWKAAAPAGQTLMPIRTEGGRLLMYLAAGKNKGAASRPSRRPVARRRWCCGTRQRPPRSSAASSIPGSPIRTGVASSCTRGSAGSTTRTRSR